MVPGLLEALVSLGGLVIPGAMSIVKGWFGGSQKDSVEDTLSNLATSKPDILPAYIQAVATNRDSETRWFNRDIAGTPSQLIIDLRGAIRPVATILAILGLICEGLGGIKLDVGTRATLCALVSSWFGDKIGGGTDAK